MSNVYESNHYDLSYRVVSHDLKSVKVYTDRSFIHSEKQISFDSYYEGISSVDYFFSSVASSMMLAILEGSSRANVEIEEIEGVFHATLKNPLTLLGVRGYTEEPVLSKLSILFYIYAEMEEEKLFSLCTKFLSQSPIYNTLIKGMEIQVSFKKLL